MDTANHGSVDATRLSRLTRGINTSHWFAQTELTPGHFHGYITPDDLSGIEALGFRHVRLNLDPNVLFDASQPQRLNPRHLRYVDAALDMILASRLAVVLDLHPDAEFKRRLGGDSGFAAIVASFWRGLARHVASRDPELVFLEVMNEPQVWISRQWVAIQAQIATAMREGAPWHTLIATGHGWSSVDDLIQLEPLPDENVVYNFHFYDPFTFTHQGATWGDPAWPYISGVPYPASPEAVAPVAQQISDERAQAAVIAYGCERWDTAKLEARLLRARSWAIHHKVSLTCNEFGVYRPATPPTARIAWLGDVRGLLERLGIGWAMWDYAEGFGLMEERNGSRVVDLQTLSALGLA
jgi:hypothetical protein